MFTLQQVWLNKYNVDNTLDPVTILLSSIIFSLRSISQHDVLEIDFMYYNSESLLFFSSKNKCLDDFKLPVLRCIHNEHCYYLYFQ